MQDIIGRPLAIGDAVAFRHSSWKMMSVGRIIGFTKKMVRVGWTRSGSEHSHLVYPNECAIIPLDDYILHALKNG
jgi:hypothetical protein